MTISILSRIEPDQIKDDPFPHVHVTQALDPAFFEELAGSYPAMQTIAGDGPLPNNRAFLKSAHSVIEDPTIPAQWREFFAYHCSQDFLQELLAFWSGPLAREYPDLQERFGKSLSSLTSGIRQPGLEKTKENLQVDAVLDCQFGVNSPVEVPSTVRGPHVDKPFKLFAALLYCRLPGDDSQGGDLRIYRLKTERYSYDGKLDLRDRYVEPVAEFPYRANTLVMWINTPRSLHGVSPRSINELPRRYVNFLVECYNTRPRGFFPIRRSLLDRARIGVRRAAGLRDA